MRRLRFLLFALVLISAANPLFAFCSYCAPNGACRPDPESGTICTQEIDFCWDTGGCGFSVGAITPTAELAVAVVEVTRPDGTNEVVIDHTVRVAEAKPVTGAAK